jgi:hypothetical protein
VKQQLTRVVLVIRVETSSSRTGRTWAVSGLGQAGFVKLLEGTRYRQRLVSCAYVVLLQSRPRSLSECTLWALHLWYPAARQICHCKAEAAACASLLHLPPCSNPPTWSLSAGTVSNGFGHACREGGDRGLEQFIRTESSNNVANTPETAQTLTSLRLVCRSSPAPARW